VTLPAAAADLPPGVVWVPGNSGPATVRSNLGAGHGTQRKHRSPGSIGGCATPSRVFKGTRMAGRMGNVRVTTQNLTVHGVDADSGLLLIKGALPGPKGGLVLVKSAAKGGAQA